MNNAESENRGQVLHREFVGMLFALAIAEVAVRSGAVVNTDASLYTKLPAITHLILAATIIAASWVGWGQSSHSLSDVKHVFSADFVELVTDVWLVAVYFFIVQGAESFTNNKDTIYGSAAMETLWVMVMFITYVIWDVWTKRQDSSALKQRLWGTIVATGLAIASFIALEDLRGLWPVVAADAALLILVMLFRVAKTRDLSKHTRNTWSAMILLTIIWASLVVAARSL